MKIPKKPPTREVCAIRLSAAERKAIQREARRVGVGWTVWIRLAALEQLRRERGERS